MTASLRPQNFFERRTFFRAEFPMFPTAESLFPDIAILDARAFPSLQALKQTAQATVKRALLLVQESDLPEVLSWLDAKDDVCLANSPPELVTHRAQNLCRALESSLDPLTRVLARQQFDQALCRVAPHATAQRPISLLMCDLDHFKKINDEYGHHVGDEVLCHVSAILRKNCGHFATIGRKSGEEFAIVCNLNQQEVMAPVSYTHLTLPTKA